MQRPHVYCYGYPGRLVSLGNRLLCIAMVTDIGSIRLETLSPIIQYRSHQLLIPAINISYKHQLLIPAINISYKH